MKKAFTQSEFSNGFTILFDNEWSVSVQWSKYHMCDGGKTTAEVAVIGPLGMFLTLVEDKL